MEWSINVYRIDTPEGPKEYVSCLPNEYVFAHGLIPEAIIGVLLRPLVAGEAITPEVFAHNRRFVEFMHEIIARRGPSLPGLIAAAQRQREGWVFVIDQRTRTPQGDVPPEDIVGAFQVGSGVVVRDSYQPNGNHIILSRDGFCQLGVELQACLLEEMTNRT